MRRHNCIHTYVGICAQRARTCAQSHPPLIHLHMRARVHTCARDTYNDHILVSRIGFGIIVGLTGDIYNTISSNFTPNDYATNQPIRDHIYIL